MKSPLNFSIDKSNNVTIAYGNILSGITSHFHFGGPQSKAAPKTTPCKALQKGQKCLARPRPDNSDQ
jgi:hypothetical protein